MIADDGDKLVMALTLIVKNPIEILLSQAVHWFVSMYVPDVQKVRVKLLTVDWLQMISVSVMFTGSPMQTSVLSALNITEHETVTAHVWKATLRQRAIAIRRP